MKKTYILLILLAQVLISCNPKPKEKGIVEIIPQPTACKIIPGFFELNAETKIVLPHNVNSLNEAGILQDVLAKVTGFTCDITTDDGIENAILFKSVGGDDMGTEGYELEVNDDQVIIRSASDAGFFYGIQTLLQILPSEVFGDTIVDRNWKIPQCQIEDNPRFSWRGMHLDVSRHFFPVSFVKKYIDLIAMHKMNKFHWHLTDDNGWRIEIKKYPKLTDVAAWRVDRTSEPWREVTPPKPGEKATYGGYYTQDEIREVVAYAAKRHVEIIPEIEMPGHTSEVFAAYPELSCAGEELYVQPGSYWPNIDIFCAGKEETFNFIENVLTEVMELFPSEYVHIGGDEATKDRWEACPLCQKRMKEEGLSNEHELQSWFIKRIEKFLNAHGKKLIGWDEILEGGLAPEATVMSWRGFQGGIDAARQGHDVVMCPTAYCYFDYYQADPDFEPEAIGGLTTLKKVYAFEPIPADLNVEQAKHILGAQGNLWTEYIQTPEHAEYMALPRMTALAEVVWTPVANRDWSDFLLRLQEQFNRFDQMDVNYSRGSWKVTIEPTWEKGAYQIALETEQINPMVHFTLDGSDPSLASPIYKQPFSIDSSVIIKAGIFTDDQLKEAISEKEIIFHKAIGLRGKLRMEPNPNYMAKGSLSLTDGLKGSDNFRDGYWLGFQGDDLDFTVDLKKPVNIQQVSISFLQNEGAWIIMPKEVKIEILDSEMQVMAKVVIQPEYQPEVVGTWIEDVASDFDNIHGNTIHIFAKNYGRLPDWHAYAGNEAWIFVDEVVVN